MSEDLPEREPGEAYYIEFGWSGCAGSAWHTLPPAAKDGWAHAERLVAGLRWRMAEAWERGNNDGLTFAAAPQKSLLTNPYANGVGKVALPKNYPLRCASCGDRATTTTVLEGFRTPVCLRHYNVWNTPNFAQRAELPDA